MKVAWAPEAVQDRIDILEYIASDNPRAAARMDELFGKAAVRLSQHPRLGRPGIVADTRELLPHEHYRLVYEIQGETVGYWHWSTRRVFGRR